MADVAIIGIGRIPVGEHWDKGLRILAAEAVQAALDDAGIQQVDALYLGNAYSSTVSGQAHLGALVADYAGLNGVEAHVTEAAEASGAAALRTAYMAVKAGVVSTALVLGVEKSTDMVGPERVRQRNVSLDADYESAHGVTLTALAAMLMRRYMYEYGLDLDAFEGFSINAHANGGSSDYAMFRNSIKRLSLRSAKQDGL
jgi:acetyl-CoA C-acetyltransferase